MSKSLLERIEEIKAEAKIVMDKAKVLRSHPFHNAEVGNATSAPFHERFAIKKDTEFKWMNNSEQLMAHGLLHFLFDRVNSGKRVEEGLTQGDIKRLHEKLIKYGRIPHSKFDELDD